jgi:hypothetical protein
MPHRLQIIDQTPTVFAQLDVSIGELEQVGKSLDMIKRVTRLVLEATTTTIQEPLQVGLYEYRTNKGQ